MQVEGVGTRSPSSLYLLVLLLDLRMKLNNSGYYTVHGDPSRVIYTLGIVKSRKP